MSVFLVSNELPERGDGGLLISFWEAALALARYSIGTERSSYFILISVHPELVGRRTQYQQRRWKSSFPRMLVIPVQAGRASRGHVKDSHPTHVDQVHGCLRPWKADAEPETDLTSNQQESSDITRNGI